MREPADERRGVEDHIRDRIGLAFHAVDDRSHDQRGRIKAGGDERPERAETVKTLGTCPLRKGLILSDQVGSGQVVDAGVAENVSAGLIRRNAAAVLADDNSEFAFPYDLAIVGRWAGT